MSAHAPALGMTALPAAPSTPLRGRCAIPGDKSISHRALLLGALAIGTTRIEGLLQSDDVLATANALRALGVPVEMLGDGIWSVTGRGIGGLAPPGAPLDFGNAGTGSRLMLALLAGAPFPVTVDGDASLRSRPMGRVLAPLMEMGLQLRNVADPARPCLPLTVEGPGDLVPIVYELPVPSAQVKSAVLLAGLHAPGETSVIEPVATRDHTERMLRHFGANLTTHDSPQGRRITVTGQPVLQASRIVVPGDPSSAAFLIAAASIVAGSEVQIDGVMLNETRTGFITTMREMGADIEETNTRTEAGERIADLAVRAAHLHGVDVPADRAPSMIDEYPILAAVAACAEGRTFMRGLGELRVKECDRLAAMAQGLAQCGVTVEEGSDTLSVTGVGGRGKPVRGILPGDRAIATQLDHRIAMAFLVLGLASEHGIAVDDTAMIATSFPDFDALMRGLGADLRRLEDQAA